MQFIVRRGITATQPIFGRVNHERADHQDRSHALRSSVPRAHRLPSCASHGHALQGVLRLLNEYAVRDGQVEADDDVLREITRLSKKSWITLRNRLTDIGHLPHRGWAVDR